MKDEKETTMAKPAETDTPSGNKIEAEAMPRKLEAKLPEAKGDATGHKVESDEQEPMKSESTEPVCLGRETAVEAGANKEGVSKNSGGTPTSHDHFFDHIMPLPNGRTAIRRLTLPPPTLALGTRTRVEAVPGAFAEGGTTACFDDDLGSIPESPDYMLTASQESVLSPVVDNSGLAVAQLLTDEDHHDPAELPQAEPAVQGGTKRTEQQAMEFKTKVFLGIVFVVSLIGTLVGLLVPGKDKQISVATTIPPTMAPTSHAQAIRANILSMFPPETVDATEDPDSPQSKAVQWLVEDENLPYLSNDRIKQRFALATFYFATNGQEWKNNQNWLNYSVHECGWYNGPEFGLKSVFAASVPGFLAEHPPPGPPPTICQNDTGLYENLWQANNNLVGSLPLELYWLTSIRTLSMGMNNGLDGSISSHVGHLTNLQGLDITKLESHDDLLSAGAIPSEIGLLTSLSILILEGNNNNGSVPTELWQLTNLSTVMLSRNPQLAFTIPTEIGTFPSLRWLLTANCNATGTIPTEIGLLKKLSLLAMWGHQLEGTIPTELGLLTAMTSMISLRDNQLSGPIPSELGLLTSLAVTLNLRGNLLSGTIPTELGLFPVLVELSISENQLTGNIPSEFGHLTMVGQLSLANNSLSGTIPQELSALQQSLHSLYLEGNPMLSGIIPEAVCAMNGTCVSTVLDPCDGWYGIYFDCTSSLCGCECPCL